MTGPPATAVLREASHARAARALGWAALWTAGAAVAAIWLPYYVVGHDEGLVLQAAERIAAGQWPYSDFWWNYGPGQPLVLAGLRELFGPSLLDWRLLRAASDATTAVLVFAIVRRRAALPVAALAWTASLGMLVIARLPNPNAAVTLLAIAAVALASRRPSVAGALGGAAVLFRPELGAVAAVCAVIGAGRAGAIRAAAWAGGMAVALMAPFVIAAGPRLVWRSTVGFDAGEQSLQRLPFPPTYSGGFDPVAILHFYLPTLLVAGFVVALIGLWPWRRAPTEAVALVPLGAAGIVYLVGRADLFHVLPLGAVLPLLLGVAAGVDWQLRRPLAVVCLAVLVLVAVDGVARRVDLVGGPPPLAAIDSSVADGVSAPIDDAVPLNRVVAWLDAHVPPGRAIFVANRRNDRVLSGQTIVYVLAQRPNATRYDVLQPGVFTSLAVQREIVGDLARKHPVVVRWLAPQAAGGEDSPAARQHGARILDDFLRRHYRTVLDRGPYAVQSWAR